MISNYPSGNLRTVHLDADCPSLRCLSVFWALEETAGKEWTPPGVDPTILARAQHTGTSGRTLGSRGLFVVIYTMVSRDLGQRHVWIPVCGVEGVRHFIYAVTSVIL